jgi:hypothetical protein
MSTRKTAQIESGCRAQTNERYASLFREGATSRAMTVIKPDRTIIGCWVVRFDGVDPLQHVHQKFIERIQ